MQTVQFIFDMAIMLIDEQNESTGSTNTTDTHEYSLRTPNLLNTLLDQVYPYSDTYPEQAGGVRPSLPNVVSMDEYLDLDDYICRNVLSYGLAALLIREENPTQANFLWQTYLENLNTAKERLPSGGIESVENVYGGGIGGESLLGWGGIEYGEFGRW